jgi:hypothetical protein
MLGDDRTRFCDQCDKHVFNLAGMSRQEAEQVIFRSEGEVCVRLSRRADGTVITNDCPVGAKRVRRRRRIAATVGGGMLAAGSMLAWQEAHMTGAVSSARSERDPGEIVEQRMEQVLVTTGVVRRDEPDESPPPEPEHTSAPKKPAPPRASVMPQPAARARTYVCTQETRAPPGLSPASAPGDSVVDPEETREPALAAPDREASCPSRHPPPVLARGRHRARRRSSFNTPTTPRTLIGHGG